MKATWSHQVRVSNIEKEDEEIQEEKPCYDGDME